MAVAIPDTGRMTEKLHPKLQRSQQRSRPTGFIGSDATARLNRSKDAGRQGLAFEPAAGSGSQYQSGLSVRSFFKKSNAAAPD
jgi:hypothetical protein